MYLTLINNKGEVILNEWTGKIFDKIVERLKKNKNLINYPLSKKQKKKLKRLNKNSGKPLVPNKKWRRSRGLLKELIRYFIKELIKHRIFRITSIQIKNTPRRYALKIFKAFWSHGIITQNFVLMSKRQHNNAKNNRFKKPKRK